jgi:orotate phosphoribosyltransferase
MTDAELARRIRERAYLEGDFVLRSGRRSRYYLDKYRFETDPELLGALAERMTARITQDAPEATRLAGPELGAVALAAATSLASGLPFLIVRKEAKGYGTDQRLEGVYQEGEEVCLMEGGLECRIAVCVVDREEGGADSLAGCGVRLVSLFLARQVAGA